jgi:hypothetical protein
MLRSKSVLLARPLPWLADLQGCSASTFRRSILI